eukprot:s469_g35.t2
MFQTGSAYDPRGFARIWSERHGTASSWPGVARTSIVIDSTLVSELTDGELQALLALEFGKLLLAPEAKWWLLESIPLFNLGWNVVKHSRTGELPAEFKAPAEGH